MAGLQNPIAQYGAEVFAKDGVRFSGDMRSGLKATIKYRVPWANTFNFVNALVRPINQVRVGMITYSMPYQLPKQIAATPLYVSSFDIQPFGVQGGMTSSTVLPYKGARAGEYYQYAAVTVGFEQNPFAWDATDDPQGMQQIDPANPIPLCSQSIKYHEKMVTLKGHKYRYVSTGQAVVGDYAVPQYGADLVLNFPHVPYQPWQLGLPNYINTVNSQPIFMVQPEQLLFASPETETKAAMLGSDVMYENSLTITLKFNPIGWNKVPKQDGTYDDVVKGDGTGIYLLSDFRVFFYQLMGYQENPDIYDPNMDWTGAG